MENKSLLFLCEKANEYIKMHLNFDPENNLSDKYAMLEYFPWSAYNYLDTPCIFGKEIFLKPIVEPAKPQINLFCKKLFDFCHNDFKKVETVCKKANLSSKGIKKVLSNKFKPSKSTSYLIALTLKLNYSDTIELLNSASISYINTEFDLLIKFFIENNIFNINTINKVLFSFNLPLLGYNFASY